MIQAALPRFIEKARRDATAETRGRPRDEDDSFRDSPLFNIRPPSANSRLQRLCSALTDFLNFSGRWDERLNLCEQAEEVALAAGSHDEAGWRAYQAGYVHYHRRQAAAVIACADRAEAHWREAGAREQAIATRLRGMGHQIAEEYPAALDAYRESLELMRSLGPESRDVSIGLADIADIEHLTGNLDASERTRREALRVAEKAGNEEGAATQVGNLAGLMLDREDWPEAERLAREALGKAEEVGRQELIGSDCRRLARALVRQGRAEEALPHARRAVAIFTQLRHHELDAARAVLRECEEAVAKASGEE